jgi:hypothetical protein
MAPRTPNVRGNTGGRSATARIGRRDAAAMKAGAMPGLTAMRRPRCRSGTVRFTMMVSRM